MRSQNNRLRVTVDGQWLAGPGDLARLSNTEPGRTITVRGEADTDRDLGRWSGPIGVAVLRGASVRRLRTEAR